MRLANKSIAFYSYANKNKILYSAYIIYTSMGKVT